MNSLRLAPRARAAHNSIERFIGDVREGVMQRGADDHLTSTEAAKLLGVSAATIKRWSDDGVLSTVRTPGGHRRFRRADLAVAADRLFTRTGGPELAEILLAPRSVLDVQAHLLAERARLGSWVAVVEACTPALIAVTGRGRSGEVPYVATAVARKLLEAAVSRCADEMPTRSDAPRVLVAAVDEEVAGVELSFVLLCLRAASWVAWSIGACEAPQLASFVNSRRADVLVALAGVTRSRAVLESVVATLAGPCSRAGVRLVLSGLGPWPADAANATIARSTGELQAWIEENQQQHVSVAGVRI